MVIVRSQILDAIIKVKIVRSDLLYQVSLPYFVLHLCVCLYKGMGDVKSRCGYPSEARMSGKSYSGVLTVGMSVEVAGRITLTEVKRS